MRLIQTALLITLFFPAIARSQDTELQPCGTVTKSILLKKDCFGPMVIEADNITVNLHGHAIRPGGIEDPYNRGGVEIFDRRGIAIKNGTIDGYDYGLFVSGGGGHTFQNLDVKRGGNGAGAPEFQVLILNVDHTIVKRVSIATYWESYPLYFVGSDSQISHVRARGDEAPGAEIGGDNLIIAHNDFASGELLNNSCGLVFWGKNGTIRRNKLSSGADWIKGGALCAYGNDTLIKDNTMIGAATGLFLGSSAAGNDIRNNYIRSTPGPYVPDAVDIRAGDNACTNTWKRNNFLTDSEGDGPNAGCIR